MSRRNIIVKIAVCLAVGIFLICLLIFYSSMQSTNVITKTELNSRNIDKMVKDAGTQDIINFSNFEELSEKTEIPGSPQVEEVKFLMIGVDRDNPQLWFINSKKYDFFTQGLGNKLL